jgi:hypothetical protein
MSKDPILPKGVYEFLLTEEEEAGKRNVEETIEDYREKRKFRFTPPVIVTIVVVVLSLIGLAIIYSSPVLREQFEALLAGELGTYKEQLRKAQEDRIREIERLSANKYGSVTLFYSPRDARVTIVERKFKLDCSKSKNDDELIECLRGKVDYSAEPEKKEIDNPSLHIDRSKKEIVEQIPLNDVPIQEASEDRKVVFRYEYLVTIEREGYYPRQFLFTADKERPALQDVETILWIERGPGVFIADFRGADLLPKPETAKDNYVKARKDLLCLMKDVEAKRKAGKNISDEAVSGVELEILNRYGFKTFDDWHRIDAEITKDKRFVQDLEKQLKTHTCQ